MVAICYVSQMMNKNDYILGLDWCLGEIQKKALNLNYLENVCELLKAQYYMKMKDFKKAIEKYKVIACFTI